MILRRTSSVCRSNPSPTQENKIYQETGLSKHVTHDRALRDYITHDREDAKKNVTPLQYFSMAKNVYKQY